MIRETLNLSGLQKVLRRFAVEMADSRRRLGCGQTPAASAREEQTNHCPFQHRRTDCAAKWWSGHSAVAELASGSWNHAAGAMQSPQHCHHS